MENEKHQMSDIPQDQITELQNLIVKQKKVRIDWLEKITGIHEASIIKIAKKSGYIIDGEYIIDPASKTLNQTSPPKRLTKNISHSRLYQSTPTKKPLIRKDPVMYGTISLSMAALSICAGPMLLLVIFLIVRFITSGSIFGIFSFAIIFLVITVICSVLSLIGVIYGLLSFREGTGKLGLLLNCLGSILTIPLLITSIVFGFL